MKHKHADLIKAWADGAEIEYKSKVDGVWCAQSDPEWDVDYEYRIKPEPKPDLIKYIVTEAISEGICRWDLSEPQFANLVLTFEGETGALKSAEVI